MWKKVIPNTLYNIGIFLCLIFGYQYGILQKQYVILFGAVIMLITFIILKVRLYKGLNQGPKKP